VLGLIAKNQSIDYFLFIFSGNNPANFHATSPIDEVDFMITACYLLLFGS
jgi:hypothetical protein